MNPPWAVVRCRCGPLVRQPARKHRASPAGNLTEQQHSWLGTRGACYPPRPPRPAGIPLAVAARACNIGLCSRIINTWREHPLPPNLQKMLLAVGLRGAVAYGLGERACWLACVLAGWLAGRLACLLVAVAFVAPLETASLMGWCV